MSHRFARNACLLLVVPLLGPAGCTCAGRRAHANLLAGAKWQYSLDRGQTWTRMPPLICGGERKAVYVRASFHVDDPCDFAFLELTHGVVPSQRSLFYLNGRRLPVPMEGMRYRAIPAIPAEMLKPGKNTLIGKIGFDNRPPAGQPDRQMPSYTVALSRQLLALTDADLKIASGPVLGAMEQASFTLTCQTNIPAEMVVYSVQPDGELGELVARSDEGMWHRLRIPRIGSDPQGRYLVVANRGLYHAVARVRAPAFPKASEPLRFVALGDSRTNTDDWVAVADAVLNLRPHLVVFSGDMVARGRNYWEWAEHYFRPCRELFATIPVYAVIGNHEENAPLYPELFYTPGGDGRSKNWSQEIRGVLLIGIDGREDFSAGSENAKWLEDVLANSQAKFTFFFTHYPAWTSGGHGRLDEMSGRPGEGPVRRAQDVLVPLLMKYGATAFVCGHDHFYERSELPGESGLGGRLTHIISGGAGAPLRGKSPQAEQQNPYSKVFASTLHYCLFEIEGDVCTMKAIDLDGQVIDSRTWHAWKPRPAARAASKPSLEEAALPARP